MASVASDPNGRKRIIFAGADGHRRAVRMGKASMKQAEAFKIRVEQLVTASITGGGIDDETARWLAALDDVTHARLAKAGLTTARERTGGDTEGVPEPVLREHRREGINRGDVRPHATVPA